jgi:hypothetical protein
MMRERYSNVSFSAFRCGDIIRTIETPLDISNRAKVERINSDFYYKDGEILPYKRGSIKLAPSISRARNRFNLLLHGNFLDKDPLYFVTLTSKELVDDDYFVSETKRFLGRYFNGEKHQLFYLGVFEEQGRGVLHCHFLAYSDRWSVPDFVSGWRLGYSDCKQVGGGISRLGVYLSAYLCKDKHGDIRRLKAFGKNAQLYFRSRNLEQPYRCTYDDFNDCVNREPISSRKRCQDVPGFGSVFIVESYYKVGS